MSNGGSLLNVVRFYPQVVAPRYSNYAEAWETGVRRIYNVSGQVVHHPSSGFSVFHYDDLGQSFF